MNRFVTTYWLEQLRRVGALRPVRVLKLSALTLDQLVWLAQDDFDVLDELSRRVGE